MKARALRSRRLSSAEQAAARRVERRLLCERQGAGRAKSFFYLVLLLAILLIGRLTYIQVVRGPELAGLAKAQHSETVEIFARRGTIYDRDRNVLARSSPSESVYVDPHLVTDAATEAAALAPLVKLPVGDLKAMFSDDTRFRWIVRKISPELARRISALHLPGVSLLDEDTGLRMNPAGRLASSVLGFVSIDEKGLAGLEYSFDTLLRGSSGKKTVEVGEGSGPIPFGLTSIDEPAKPGRSLVLTLDSYLQYVTERALSDGVHAFAARSGSAIVMDPWNGEILALANVPDYDPNAFGARRTMRVVIVLSPMPMNRAQPLN